VRFATHLFAPTPAVAVLDEQPVSQTIRDIDSKPGLSRRDLLRAAVVAVPPLVTIAGTARAMDLLDEFRIRRLTIPLSDLPSDLDGMTIAHVSDIHVGTFTRGKTLAKIVEATNSLKPDLVLQTGDLINRALADLPAAIDMTNRMDSRFGQFICEGNHDLIESRDEFERRVTAAGLPVLINRSDEVRVRGTPVQILGLRWGRPGWMGRGDLRRSSDEVIAASMSEVLMQRRADAFPILLAHHPHAFDVAARNGIPLTLAGHTHGGQLHLTENIGFGPRMFRYWSGLYQKENAALVVSNGVGNWFPLRINAPAEIVHITLRRA
jgi:predicted MPP superfamily phosphohydrolase